MRLFARRCACMCMLCVLLLLCLPMRSQGVARCMSQLGPLGCKDCRSHCHCPWAGTRQQQRSLSWLPAGATCTQHLLLMMPAHIKAEGKAYCDDKSTSTCGSAHKTQHTPAGPLVRAVPPAWPGGPSRLFRKSSFAVGKRGKACESGLLKWSVHFPPPVWALPSSVRQCKPFRLLSTFTATDMQGTDQAKTNLS